MEAAQPDYPAPISRDKLGTPGQIRIDPVPDTIGSHYVAKVGYQRGDCLAVIPASLPDLDGQSASSACRLSPTSPPTSVPLIRIYWRSRPTAASSRLVIVCASQRRTVSLTSLTIEEP
jgi:hypothetical protein